MLAIPILTTKLYIPPPRPNFVRRPRLIARLNERPHRKLTLISAPAGFGKTTLVSDWIYDSQLKTSGKGEIATHVAWFSLDEADNDPVRFLNYLVATLQTIAPHIGEGVLPILHSHQPPPTELILTALLNDLANIPDNFTM